MNPPLVESSNIAASAMPAEKSAPEIRRRVSRVESLRRLLLGASHIDSKRLFEKRKYRFGRNPVAKADKSIGTDLDLLGGSEDDLFDRSSSRFNVSCDSFDLDSVSQLSLADTTSDGKGSLPPSKSISIDNIPQEMASYLRSGFSTSFLKSKLASLPEEQGTLTRSCRRPRSGSVAEEDAGPMAELLTGPQSLNSEVKGGTGTLRRKRSQSLADIQLSHLQVPLQFRTGADTRHKNFTKTKSEESGYDSDTTRKSGSSPRGSVKSDSFDPSETDSSTCDSHLKPDPAPTSGDFTGGDAPLSGHYNEVTSPPPPKPKIKKPPRKSKEEQKKNEISCQTDYTQTQFQPKLEFAAPAVSGGDLVGGGGGGKPIPALPINFSDNMPSTLPSLTSKSFKMLRLVKQDTDELGIIISKKRNPSKGTTGYIIAHVEPDGLVNK